MYNENVKHKSFIYSAIEQTKLTRAFYDSFVEEWVQILKKFLALPDEILQLEQNILSYEQNCNQNISNSKFMLLHFDASNMRNQIIKFIEYKNQVFMDSKIWQNKFLNKSNFEQNEVQQINHKEVTIQITEQTNMITENLLQYVQLQKKYPAEFQQMKYQFNKNSFEIEIEDINMFNLNHKIHKKSEDALLEIMLKVGLSLQRAHDNQVFFANINPYNILQVIDKYGQTKVLLSIPNILDESYTDYTSGTQRYSQGRIFKDFFVYTNSNISDIISFTKILYYLAFQDSKVNNIFESQTQSMKILTKKPIHTKINCILQQIQFLYNSNQLGDINQINNLIHQQLYVGSYQNQEKIQQVNQPQNTFLCQIHQQINKYSFKNGFVCIECIIGMQQKDQQYSTKKNAIYTAEFFKQFYNGEQMLNSFQMKVQNIIIQIE